MELQDVINNLPQQYPFRMIDSVVEYKEGVSLTAIKNITGNELCYEGQTNVLKKFPETLIMEAAAQAALTFFKMQEKLVKDKTLVLGKIKSEFFDQVNIGDQLCIKTGSFKIMGQIGYAGIQCFVERKKIADIQIFFSLLAEGK